MEQDETKTKKRVNRKELAMLFVNDSEVVKASKQYICTVCKNKIYIGNKYSYRKSRALRAHIECVAQYSIGSGNTGHMHIDPAKLEHNNFRSEPTDNNELKRAESLFLEVFDCVPITIGELKKEFLADEDGALTRLKSFYPELRITENGNGITLLGLLTSIANVLTGKETGIAIKKKDLANLESARATGIRFMDSKEIIIS